MNPDELFDEERYRPTPGDALPAADLTELLAQAASNRAYELEFYRRLLTDSLAMLVQEWPQNWEPGSQEAVPLKPLFLQSGELPVFTSLQTLFANPNLDPEATPYVFVNGRELLTGMQQYQVLINPFSMPNILLPPEFIGELLAGDYARRKMADQVDALEAPLAVSSLEPIPPAQQVTAAQLATQLALLLHQHPRVRQGHLLWQNNEGTGAEDCFVVFIDVEGATERLGQELAFVASTLLDEAQLNLRIFFNPDPNSFRDLAEQLQIVPFYQD